MTKEKLEFIIVERCLVRPPPSPSGVVSISAGHAQHQSVPVYEMKFPDLCVY